MHVLRFHFISYFEMYVNVLTELEAHGWRKPLPT